MTDTKLNTLEAQKQHAFEVEKCYNKITNFIRNKDFKGLKNYFKKNNSEDRILKQDALKYKNNNGETPLFLACRSGNLEIVKFLAHKYGSNTYLINNVGRGIIDYDNINPDIVKYIKQTQEQGSYNKAVAEIISNNYENLLNTVIKYKNHLNNLQNNGVYDILEVAIKRNDTTAMEILKIGGINITKHIEGITNPKYMANMELTETSNAFKTLQKWKKRIQNKEEEKKTTRKIIRRIFF